MSISIRGVGKLKGFLLGIVPKTRRMIQDQTELHLRLMQGEAVDNAPVDTGKLRQSITFDLVPSGLGGSLSANVDYWAYVEFGTGGLVSVPEGFEDLASGFKGKGKRTINLAPQPFLIPAYKKYADAYFTKIQQLLPSLFR